MPVAPTSGASPSTLRLFRLDRFRLLLMAGLLAFSSVGCSKSYVWRVESDLCMDPDFQSKKGASVYAYTSRDSTRIRFEGRAWLRTDDTVVFDTSSRGMDAPVEERLETQFKLRRSELRTIEYRKQDVVANSFIAGFSSAVLIFGLWVWSLQ